MNSRREFLALALRSTVVVGAVSRLPTQGLAAAGWSKLPNPQGRILVVVQLSGGNDGMNTVIPVADDEYYRNRFATAIPRVAALKLDDYQSLHPQMTGMHKLFEAGKLAVVNGVGYPQPNRSHFESMDLWHSAHRSSDRIPTGWLGRWGDRQSEVGDKGSSNLASIFLGDEEKPMALIGEQVQPTAIRSLERFRMDLGWNGNNLKRSIGASRDSDNDLLTFVQSATTSAIATSEQIERSLGNFKSRTEFPQSNLGQKLQTVAQLIGSDLAASVYYVTLDGFDTHANQAQAHAGLLQTLSEAVAAFQKEIDSQGNSERVMLFSFSEFGRRVRENASGGTDHGSAAPVFLIGDSVKGGLQGRYPSLTDLDDGDLKFHTDYRRVYATLLERWLGANFREIVGEDFAPLDLI